MQTGHMVLTIDQSQIAPPGSPRRSLIAEILSSLEKIAAYSPNLISNYGARFEAGGKDYELPRYLFIGPKGGNAPIRLGLFSGVYGDELESVLALTLFIHLLEAKPDLAAGYCLFLYPVCNPSGLEHGTRYSANKKDLNHEFWNHSREPEVQLLQSEIVSHALEGMISLYTNGTEDQFFAFERSGGGLTKHLIEPALQAVREFSQNYRPAIFRSHRKAAHKNARGILSAPPEMRPKPFEIILETAQTRAAWQMVALLSILEEYRKFIAYAPNL